MIDSYTFGKFVVDEKEYESNIILLGKIVNRARYLPDHGLAFDDIIPLVEYKPEYIVIGTGASGVMPVSDEIKELIETKGIKLIVEKTPDACRTYNSLLSENKKVAAFLHDTC